MSARPASAGRTAVNPWLIAIAVVIPTFMEILDTTIANVALRYIAGGLKATSNDSEWVITSYLAANAFVLPLTGWISSHFGRRNYFLLSIGMFTFASVGCGLSTSLAELILFRVLQGLAGGGLQPMTQAILLDSFPPERQGAAQSLFGVAALIGPVVGPALGGYLTTTYSWHWIFFINLPVGLLAMGACVAVVRDPPEFEAERAALRKKPLNLDYIGIGLLALIMSCWEVTLSKGQEWDWFGDPRWRVQTLVAVLVIGFALLLVQEFRHSNPVLNFRPLADRNFTICCIMISLVYASLYAANTSLPRVTQSLFGYDAFRSGLLQTPAGVCAFIPMIGGGILMGKGLDTRWLIGAGLLISASGQFALSLATPGVSPRFFTACQIVSIFGLSTCFAPLSVTAYAYVSPKLRGAAVGLFSLLRNEGGSFGTSTAQTIEDRRQQFHLSRLTESLSPFGRPVREFLSATEARLVTAGGDPVSAKLQAMKLLDQVRQQQAMLMASVDVFVVCSAVSVGLFVFVFLLKPTKSKGGAPAAE